MNLHGIVVGAGAGSRFGESKAVVILDGKPLWEWARDALLAGGVRTVVLVGSMPGGVAGGPRRRDSVRNGLESLPAAATHVLVHDAARPLATAALAAAVAGRLAVGDVEGVVPAVPMRDTIKRVSGESVSATLPRSDLVAVQTPQGFLLEALLAAHRADDEDAPDDAAMVERAGGRVVVVPGEPSNLKITYREDLAVARTMVR